METDTATRYRSRILREMNANRDNPFNSPPSSTGSHGTVSPTLSSVFTDPDGESTRKLNEDIARVTAPRKLPVNWDAAHRKWPEFYSKPKARDAPIFDDHTETRPMSAESKENRRPSFGVKFADDSTQDIWEGSKRTRAEMQPRVDEGSDLSSILGQPPTRGHPYHGLSKNTRNPSPLAKVHSRVPSAPVSDAQRRPSISDALDRLRRASLSPRNDDQGQRESRRDHGSPHISSAKSSLTAVPPSPASVVSHGHNASNGRSFFMPDVSHLEDFVTGTLRFSGSNRNGVPVFVKHGRVHDRQERPYAMRHAEVDGVEVPEEEEKIFVSMDMIRDEIISLQGHYDKVHEYAESLQQQVDRLEAQLKSRKQSDGVFGADRADQRIIEQKNRLEVEVATMQSRLEQASQKMSLHEIEKEALAHEKDRAVKKLQEACEDINKLTRKLSSREKKLNNSQKLLESTEDMRQDNDTLRRDLVSLRHGREALEMENDSLRADNEAMRREQAEMREEMEALRAENNTTRREHQSLISENISLRSNNKALMEENEDLRENLDGVQHELDAAREEVETLRHELDMVGQEKTTLAKDNSGLVRHNNKYFGENKVLRRENSGFERSVHQLHEENLKLQDEIENLKEQLENWQPVPKEDFSARLDEATEENMTSAFFIPDITMHSDVSEPADKTNTKDVPVLPEMPELPELTSQSEKDLANEETQLTVQSAKEVVNDEIQLTVQSAKDEATKTTEQTTQGAPQHGGCWIGGCVKAVVIMGGCSCSPVIGPDGVSFAPSKGHKRSKSKGKTSSRSLAHHHGVTFSLPGSGCH